jgi:hypothetical protein
VPILLAPVLLAGSAAGPGSAAPGSQTPRSLVKSLLEAPVPRSELPPGYKSPVVGRYRLTAKAKSHQAVGGVQIELRGGDASVTYIVFASKAGAKADWTSAKLKGISTRPGPASLPQPSLVITTSASGRTGGKEITVGLTDVAYLFGNVIVQAVTSSTASATHGDVAGATALARFALGHLVDVSASP